MKKTAFLIGGGTGGHLFAAIALGEELQELGHDVHIITDTRCQKYLDTLKSNFHIHILNITSPHSPGLGKVRSLLQMILSWFKSLMLIKKYSPNVIIGFGGYTTVPIIAAGIVTMVPIIIHEQNLFLGKANRIFARFAKKVTTAFKLNNLSKIKYQNKILVVGNPIRKEFKVDIKRNFDNKPFRLLVTGGSQAAKIFSTLVPNAIKLLVTHHPEIQLEIFHQAASEDIECLEKTYKRLKIKYEVNHFFSDMLNKYKNNHLLISRAGASTISEVIALLQPTIFIPYPHATNNHQLLNAKIIESHNACWCLEQDSITPQILSDKILELALSPKLLYKVSMKLAKMKKNTGKQLVEVVEQSMN